MLRMKWRAVGVIASSSRCGGVSALTGRSFSRVSPSLPTRTFSSANAAGMSPPGMLRWNGIAAPDHRGHGSEARAAEESAPVGTGFAAEEGAVRRGRIPGEEFVEVGGFAGRGVFVLT